MIMVFLAALVASGVVQALVLPILRHHAMDLPNVRSSHVVPTPRAGGVAVTLAVGCAIAVAAFRDEPVAWVAVVAAFAFAVVGLVEDVRGVGVLTRLKLQLVTGVALAAGLLIGNTQLQGVALAVAAAAVAVWITGFANAFNFMDGVNGISGLNAVLATGWFTFVGLRWDLAEVTVLALAVGGAACGFLPWNAPRARVFLGDCGSYLLGAALAILGVLALIGGVPLGAVVGPFLVYVADTGWTLVRRVSGGRIWREAHREHVYQRLVDGGAGHTEVSLLTASTALLCAVLLGLNEGPGLVVAVAGVALIIVGYLALPAAVSLRSRVDAASSRLHAKGGTDQQLVAYGMEDGATYSLLTSGSRSWTER